MVAAVLRAFGLRLETRWTYPKQGADRRCRFTVRLLDEVGARQPERGRGVGMSQPATHRPHRHTSRKEASGSKVPEIVEPHTVEPGLDYAPG